MFWITNTLLLTLIWLGRGVIFPLHPCWFSLNNSKAVKAVALAFWLFIGDIHAKFGIPNLSQCLGIGQNPVLTPEPVMILT